MIYGSEFAHLIGDKRQYCFGTKDKHNITKQKDIHMEEILKTRKILYGR